MERNANYAAVGAFVLLVALVGALFVYWYTDTREHRHYNRYEVYFDGSVSGLERGAAVRNLGVGVGRVVDMRIDPRDPNRVQVVVDIDATTPISDKTVAELSLQGVTGLLYIDLLRNRPDRPELPLVPSLKYPVIRSAPSRLSAFLERLPDLVEAAGDLVQRADHLLSDANLTAFSSALNNINQASVGLPQTLHDFNSLLVDLRSATQQIAGSAHDLRGVIDTSAPDVEATVQRLRAVSDNLAKATDLVEKVIAENRQDVRSFARDGLPEIERFVREGRAAAEDIRTLSNSLR
ncbi:MAG TPA: MlaD family protein, partial [Steroidobacteraceae bacterium]|nr:MlaD family protein [Steroidobacteraceae bacterium]